MTAPPMESGIPGSASNDFVWRSGSLAAVVVDQAAVDLTASHLALAWVHEHIGEYGGDPEQFCLMGHSAGAHLVALVGTDETYLAAHGLTLGDISAVVPLDTQAYDIAALAERRGGELPPAYRVPFTNDPQLWAAASPITHLGPDKRIPPMVIPYSGGRDPRRRTPWRAEAAQQFAEALRQAGTTAEVVPAPDKTHAQIARQFGADGDHVAEAVFAFLQRVLGLARADTLFRPAYVHNGAVAQAPALIDAFGSA